MMPSTAKKQVADKGLRACPKGLWIMLFPVSGLRLTRKRVYDPAGNVRIKKRTDSLGQANATLLYDSLGRVHRMRVSGGRTTLLRYGALGQRLGTTQWEANGDADGDGFVGSLDLDLFFAQFQAGSESGESADFDGDLTRSPRLDDPQHVKARLRIRVLSGSQKYPTCLDSPVCFRFFFV
jgi:hypothetical protein